MTVRDFVILGSSSQTPTRFRNQSAYLLRWNHEGFLFDPGEGTQRQFIYANIAPTCITRIFISHFHGDHCLGLGSMLMRLNLDKITRPIHCYYPGRYKKFFDRLRYGTVYHDTLNVVEHPVYESGLVHEENGFRIEATFLDHGIDCIGWRIQEEDQIKFDKEALQRHHLRGPLVKELETNKKVQIGDQTITLEEVSWVRKGDIFAYALDSQKCPQIIDLAKDAKLFVCESTYMDQDKHLAESHRHMTAKQAAQIAKDAQAKQLVLTHFSARYQRTQDLLEEARTIFPNTEVAEDFKIIPFIK